MSIGFLSIHSSELFIHLSNHPSSFYPTIHTSNHSFIHPSICISIHLSRHPSDHPSIRHDILMRDVFEEGDFILCLICFASPLTFQGAYYYASCIMNVCVSLILMTPISHIFINLFIVFVIIIIDL